MNAYLAICLDCEPILPVPFATKSDRDDWATAHETTGHRVNRALQQQAPTPASRRYSLERLDYGPTGQLTALHLTSPDGDALITFEPWHPPRTATLGQPLVILDTSQQPQVTITTTNPGHQP